MMDEPRRFCATCQAEMEIVSIITDADSSVITMSCGHRFITKVITEKIGTLERLDDRVKRDGKTIHKGMHRHKISRVSKRSTRESLVFDWKTRTKYHKIEELQDDGTWKMVHEETVPFETKKAN